MENINIQVNNDCDTCIKSDVCIFKDSLDSRVENIKDMFEIFRDGFGIDINIKCNKWLNVTSGQVK